MFIAALFVMAKTIQNSNALQRVDGETKEYYSAIKKNKLLTYITTWMNPKSIMLSERNQV